MVREMSKSKKKKRAAAGGVVPGEPIDPSPQNQTDVNNPGYKVKVKGTNTNNGYK